MKNHTNYINKDLFSGWNNVFRHENLLHSNIAGILEQQGYSGYEIYMPNPSGHTSNTEILDLSRLDDTSFEEKIIRGMTFKEKPFGELLDSLFLFGRSYADLQNKALFIAPGDCAILSFYNDSNEFPVMGITHSGWKGTAQDIVGKTINELEKNFGEDVKKDLSISISPFAQSCCMEFGQNTFEKSFLEGKIPFGKETKKVQPLGDKYSDLNIRNYLVKGGKSFYLNTEGLLKDMLLHHDISEENINMSEICTICDGHEKGFYSSRIDNTKRFGVIVSG